MKTQFLILHSIFCLGLTAHGEETQPPDLSRYESPQGSIRVTGDTTGISFAKETAGAKPINGNVTGVSFSQWVTGFKDNLSDEPLRYTKKIQPLNIFNLSPPKDKTKILTAGTGSMNYSLSLPASGILTSSGIQERSFKEEENEQK